MIISYLWYGIFLILLISYLFVQFSVKSKKRYFIYFIAGCILGFYFDLISFTNGYYNYPDFYAITIFGLPFSMTLAEGFSVAVTVYVFEIIRKRK